MTQKELHNCYISNCNHDLLSNKYDFKDAIDTTRKEINRIILELTESFNPKELQTVSGVTKHLLIDNLKEDGDFKLSSTLRLLTMCGYSLQVVQMCKKDKSDLMNNIMDKYAETFKKLSKT